MPPMARTGTLGGGDRLAQPRHALRGPEGGLRRRRVYRSEEGEVGSGGGDLRHGVGRDADKGAGREEASRHIDRHRRASEVHAVRTRGHGDVHAIVHQQQRAGPSRQLTEAFGEREQRTPRQVSFPELHRRQAGVERRSHHVAEVAAPGGVAVVTRTSFGTAIAAHCSATGRAGQSGPCVRRQPAIAARNASSCGSPVRSMCARRRPASCSTSGP